MSPEILKRLQELQRMGSSGSSGYNPQGTAPTLLQDGANSYWTGYTQNGTGESGDGGYTPVNHFGWDTEKLRTGNQQVPGTQYGLDGTNEGPAYLKNANGADLLAMAIAAAGGMGMLGSSLAGGGTGLAGAGDAGMMYAGADAASAGSLGGGASVAGGASMPMTSVMGAGGAGLGATGGGMSGAAFGDAGMMYGGADAAAAGSLGGGAAVGGGGGGGILDSILGGAKALGSSGVLGPALTLAGAALGKQGLQSEQTTSRQITPELMPYLQGPQGLWEMTAQQMRQPTPYGGLLNQGMAMMNRPVAGNPFMRGV